MYLANYTRSDISFADFFKQDIVLKLQEENGLV